MNSSSLWDATMEEGFRNIDLVPFLGEVIDGLPADPRTFHEKLSYAVKGIPCIPFLVALILLSPVTGPTRLIYEKVSSSVSDTMRMTRATLGIHFR